jgi:hypothetical protein
MSKCHDRRSESRTKLFQGLSYGSAVAAKMKYPVFTSFSKVVFHELELFEIFLETL